MRLGSTPISGEYYSPLRFPDSSPDSMRAIFKRVLGTTQSRNETVPGYVLVILCGTQQVEKNGHPGYYGTVIFGVAERRLYTSIFCNVLIL